VKLVLPIKKTPIIASENKNTACKELMKNIGLQKELEVNLTDLLIAYLTIGVGVYAAAACYNISSFEGAGAFAILKGIVFGILLWPVALYILYLENE
jgi:hypothetical protein